MSGSLQHTQCSVESRQLASGRYEAVIAVNDDVGDGVPVSLLELETGAYMRNPVVHFAHDFRQGELPIGRSTSIRRDDKGRLVAEFEFLPGDARAARVRNAWERGFLRAGSITWDARAGSRPVLREWSIVALPADVDAVRGIDGLTAAVVQEKSGSEEREMDEEKIREIVADALKGRSTEEEQTHAIAAAVTAAVRSQVEEALKQRDASAAEAKAAAEKAAADAASARKAETDMQARAAERADLLVRCRDLLPADFDAVKATDKDILVAAVGAEVADAAKRDEGYLRGALDQIVARRGHAGPQSRPTSVGPPPQSGAEVKFTRGPSVLDLRRMRDRRAGGNS